MNNKEFYEIWCPVSIKPCKVIVEKIEDNNEGLVIELGFPYDIEYEGKIMKLNFRSYVAYRNMNESYRARTFGETGGFKFSLYKVIASSWLNWLHEESLGIYKDTKISHYSIITELDCIDILSELEPKVSWK